MSLSLSGCPEPLLNAGPGAPNERDSAIETSVLVAEATPIVEPSVPDTSEVPTAEPVPEEPSVDDAPAPDPEALAQAALDRQYAAFEQEHPWHGVSYHFLAQIHRRPDGDSPVTGYMRRGTQFRAQEGLRGPGCARGWHRLSTGGFVCRGNGYQLGHEPQTFEGSPAGAALGDALPYAYAWVTRDQVPQYWRLPSTEEEASALSWIERDRARQEQAEANSAEAAADAEGPVADLETPPGLENDAQTGQAGTDDPAAEPATDEPQDDRPSVLRMTMRRGYYVSVDRLEVDGERRFYRTIRGAYVPADVLAEVQAPRMRGVVLGARWQLPVGFVYRGGVRSLRRDPVRGVLNLDAPIERSTPLPLSAEVIERRGRRYRISLRGEILREDALRIARPRERPPEVAEGQRWVHVNLAEQTLVAYEGDAPVFATLVATGRTGYETPTGTFRIQSKHVSTTMDDINAGAESYSIEDVPWTLYFEGSYALHTAFWHDRFGRVRSHGCVNLSPTDARWIFSWTGPELPAGWHGLSTLRGQEATWVHITEE